MGSDCGQGFNDSRWRNFSNKTQFKINPLSGRPGVVPCALLSMVTLCSLCQFSVGFHVINVAMSNKHCHSRLKCRHRAK